MLAFPDKDTIAGWTAVIGIVGAVGKYFLDSYSEKSAIQGAFLVEVERLLWVIKRHLVFVRGKYQEHQDPLIPFSTDLYDKQIENVGKLPRRLAEKIVKFYGCVKFLNQIQITRNEFIASGRAANFRGFYLQELERLMGQFGTSFDADFKRKGIERSS